MQINAVYQKKYFWQDMMIIFILGLTPLIWFKGGIVVAGSDAGYPLFNPIRFNLEHFFMWESRVNCGMPAAINATSLFFHSVQAFFSWLGFSLQNSQKFLFVFWFDLICLSIYYLISVIQREKPNRLQRLLAVCFYAFNPLLFNIWEAGQAANLSAYVAMPVILALLIQALERRMSYVKAVCLIGVFSVVVSEIGASPSIIAIPAALFVFYFLLFFVKQILSGARFKNLIQPLIFLLAVCAGYILINAYWWMPYLKEICDKLAFKLGSDLEAFNLANWLTGISTYTSFLNVARFQGAWDWYWGWNDEPYVPYAHHYFSNMFLILMSVFVPILASLALLVRRNFYTVFFAVVAVAGNLLAMGAHMPYGNIFLWLTRNCPFFTVFRSPYYKFSLATALAYPYLVSVILSDGWDKIKNSQKLRLGLGAKKTKYLAAIVIILAVVCNFIYNFPMVTGQVIKKHDYGKLFSVRLKIPQYVFDFTKWMEKQDGNYRIISLPQQNLDCYRWGYVAPPHLLNLLITKPVLWGSADMENSDTIRNIYYDALYNYKTDNASKILSLLNVKYLFLPNDAWYDFYGDTDSPEFVRERLAFQKNIKFSRKFGEWELYEVNEPSSAVYAASGAHIVSGGLDSLIALAHKRYLDGASLIFSRQAETVPYIRVLVDKRQAASVIFCDTHLLDFALDIMENKQKCAVVKKEERANFSIASEGIYEVLLERKSLGDINREIIVLVDDEKLVFGNGGGKTFSQNYINAGSIFLNEGKHELKVPVTDLEKTDVVPSWNFMIVSQSEMEDCAETAAKLLGSKDADLDMFFSTPNMSYAINKEPSKKPNALSISKMKNFYEPMQSDDDEIWFWLKTNQQDNIFIQNNSGQPARTNFGFKVKSYERERTLYVYLNEKLFKIILLPKGEPVDVIITGMEFEAGENIISFYTPYQWDTLKGRTCNFAFRDFELGSLNFSQEIYVPKTGQYDVRIFSAMPIAESGKKISIGGKEAVLNKDDKKSSAFGAKMFLTQGNYTVRLSQENAENYFLSLALPPQAGDTVSKPLKHRRINPVKYKVEVNDDKPFFLIFSEAFSPSWKAYARPLIKDKKNFAFEQSLILDMLRDKARTVEIKEHYLMNGYANGWYVDAGGLPVPYEIIIEYSPQRLFETGLAVSGITFILCFICLIACGRNKFDRKRNGVRINLEGG